MEDPFFPKQTLGVASVASNTDLPETASIVRFGTQRTERPVLSDQINILRSTKHSLIAGCSMNWSLINLFESFCCGIFVSAPKTSSS